MIRQLWTANNFAPFVMAASGSSDRNHVETCSQQHGLKYKLSSWTQLKRTEVASLKISQQKH
jgi:hypothetical protein